MINEGDPVGDMDSQDSMTALRLLARWALRRAARRGGRERPTSIIDEISKGYTPQKTEQLT